MVYSGRLWFTEGTDTADQLITPTVHRIVSTIAERIHSRRYEGGEWLPTERALGEEFGVSRATIRLAITELEKRRLLVRSTGRRPLVHGGTPMRSRRHGSLRRSIGLWISSDPTDAGASRTTLGVQRALDHDAFRLVLSSPLSDEQDAGVSAEASSLSRLAQENDVAGILLWYIGGEANLRTLESVRAAGIPMVFLDRRPPAGCEADHAGVDNVRAAEDVIAHLVAEGHTRIGHVTSRDACSTVRDRLVGYRQGLQFAGLPHRPSLVLSDLDDLGRFVERERPTALFVVNDHCAFEVVSQLRNRGIRVPEDIAVAGFDDQEATSRGVPFLTTVHQPFERIGAEAVRLLLDRLDNGETATFRHILLDAPLVVRESTRTPRR